MPLPHQTGRRGHYVLRLSVCPSVRLLPYLWTWWFENEWTDFFSCELVHGIRGWSCQLWGPECQTSRSHEAKDTFVGLAEASFSTSLSQVAFLVLSCVLPQPYASIPWGSAGPDPHNNLVVRVLYGLDPHNNTGKLLHKNVKKGRFWCFKPCTLNATSSVPSPWKCTKIVGDWGFTPDPTGGVYSALPDPLAGLRGLLLRGGKGKWGDGRDFEPSQCWRQIDARVIVNSKEPLRESRLLSVVSAEAWWCSVHVSRQITFPPR